MASPPPYAAHVYKIPESRAIIDPDDYFASHNIPLRTVPFDESVDGVDHTFQIFARHDETTAADMRLRTVRWAVDNWETAKQVSGHIFSKKKLDLEGWIDTMSRNCVADEIAIYIMSRELFVHTHIRLQEDAVYTWPMAEGQESDAMIRLVYTGSGIFLEIEDLEEEEDINKGKDPDYAPEYKESTEPIPSTSRPRTRRHLAKYFKKKGSVVAKKKSTATSTVTSSSVPPPPPPHADTTMDTPKHSTPVKKRTPIVPPTSPNVSLIAAEVHSPQVNVSLV